MSSMLNRLFDSFGGGANKLPEMTTIMAAIQSDKVMFPTISFIDPNVTGAITPRMPLKPVDNPRAIIKAFGFLKKRLNDDLKDWK